ncbi:hypothetical protein PV11_05407 [Exophiala sideris]|uniref:Nodulin-like domain-containing protein n=1 Tax=Exophiala sideris TaxID=1016849 RepID=A0A0D1X6I0_9EURO|nr:hypothetical protein PV11_05407 [Exophiala sideris]
MMLASDPHKRARIVTVIACTTIALACGTNYGYSIWGPSFAARLKLSATNSNLIGTIGNLGMYAFGVPSGMMVDAKGPRWGVTLGVILFAVGYYPIARAYKAGPGAYSVGTICLFSFFTGAGSCTAFSASIKAAALNFPESRGTATAFPLAAFGLSAMFFAAIDLLLPSGTYNFLVLLAAGTVALPVLSFPFLRVLPPQSYHKVAQHDRQVLHRTRSSGDPDHPHYEEPDIRGFALLPLPEFWQLFSMLGLLTGIGLMTINNIGNDAQALWKQYDPNTTPAFIQKRQAIHVAILSFCSFAGRLTSGIGSDFLVSKLGRSRFWCLFASALVFCLAQLAGTAISTPKMLVFLSGLTGFAYGMLFGVFPSLVAHCFGVHGLSQNWGTMTLAPVVSGNIFNILYGKIYDAHSIKNEDGDMECLQGRKCYSTAYWVTFGAAILGVGCCLWSIWHEYRIHKQRNGKEGERSDHERIA